MTKKPIPQTIVQSVSCEVNFGNAVPAAVEPSLAIDPASDIELSSTFFFYSFSTSA
jgi:hypothetical protein